jgi:hypothetical protein
MSSGTRSAAASKREAFGRFDNAFGPAIEIDLSQLIPETQHPFDNVIP